MRSFFENKLWIAFVSLLALGALLMLAAGMRDFSFRRAQSFSRAESTIQKPVADDLISSAESIPPQTQLGVLVLFVVMIVLIGSLLSPELRKRLFRMVLRAALTFLALYIIFTRYPEILAQLGASFAQAANGPVATPSNAEPLPVFMPPPTVSWASYLVSFGLAVLFVLLVWKLYSSWKEIPSPASSMKKLASIARTSLRDLSSGRDSTDVIMNCYYRMSDVVADKQNISRRESMTPNEFALHLERTGLPGDAVRRLTRLFESVRYGGHKSDPMAVNEAVACLTTILQHCGEAI